MDKLFRKPFLILVALSYETTLASIGYEHMAILHTCLYLSSSTFTSRYYFISTSPPPYTNIKTLFPYICRLAMCPTLFWLTESDTNAYFQGSDRLIGSPVLLFWNWKAVFELIRVSTCLYSLKKDSLFNFSNKLQSK